MRVLVVEDERKLAAQVREALSAAGFSADAAHDGEEARLLGGMEP